ncbi:hairy-related 3 [Oryzias melastigma]|uniref:Hairy-related 3 n=1 Tax=Oryzias melastigma TaxID=30732 RepID=A0A3B3D2U3_ORYME|nr:hairy-related 3 [Oryzias melastigma]
MVASADCVGKPKPPNKVSKPLMEKKRRARINQCLDELKFLLENYYSSSIRKRKLEKADILELTVKHLRNLQKIQSCTAASECPDYQTGYHNCLANVSQFLMTTDTMTGSGRWMLTQLSHKLCRSLRRGEASSTLDSAARQTEAQKRLPASTRTQQDVSSTEAQKPHSACSTPSSQGVRQTSESKKPHITAEHRQNISISFHKDLDCVSHDMKAANAARSVWRPW